MDLVIRSKSTSAEKEECAVGNVVHGGETKNLSTLESLAGYALKMEVEPKIFIHSNSCFRCFFLCFKSNNLEITRNRFIFNNGRISLHVLANVTMVSHCPVVREFPLAA